MLSGGKLRDELTRELEGRQIENLPIAFGAVATEIGAGHEVWLRKGDLVHAIRASYAMPGIFEPVCVDNRWLFDGALVNPVPVTLCRAMGAELVIAVNLVGDAAYRGALIADAAAMSGDHKETSEHLERHDPSAGHKDHAVEAEPQKHGSEAARQLRRQFGRSANGAPGIAAAMLDAFNITQDRIARSRLAGDPPDVLISARLSKIGFFDFHRADELIALGREAARRALNDIAEIAALENPLAGPPPAPDREPETTTPSPTGEGADGQPDKIRRWRYIRARRDVRIRSHRCGVSRRRRSTRPPRAFRCGSPGDGGSGPRSSAP